MTCCNDIVIAAHEPQSRVQVKEFGNHTEFKMLGFGVYGLYLCFIVEGFGLIGFPETASREPVWNLFDLSDSLGKADGQLLYSTA